MEDLIKRLLAQEQENTSAIAIQKEVTSQLRVDVNRLLTQVAAVGECVHRIEVEQARRSALAQCPQPGLCLELQKQMEKMAGTTQTLVENRAEARGIIKTTVLLAGIIGSLGGAALSYVLQLIIKHP